MKFKMSRKVNVFKRIIINIFLILFDSHKFIHKFIIYVAYALCQIFPLSLIIELAEYFYINSYCLITVNRYYK